MASTNNPLNQREDYSPRSAPEPRPGPFLARVISHLDPTYMGILEVEILRPTGATAEEGQLHQVKYMSPFYGVTKLGDIAKDPNNYNNTQQSYGMWMVPPDVGTTVVIIFIDGDPKRGYWIGCVQDDAMNFMVPGIAATQTVVETEATDSQGRIGRVPTGEYNKLLNTSPGDPDKVKKPAHPLATILTSQGLILDDIRGITTSSARREAPSSVFGISTPGPLDKRTGARQGPIGKAEWLIPNAYLSRLGGTSFVMDDGDDKFLRKTKADVGPPEYVAVETGETGGDVTLPHNELVRFRTRTGHQILLHNTEDLIYIGNAKGTTWIELTSNGKIDIFADDSISIHTKNDLNFYADRDINMEAGRNVNVKAGNRLQTESVGNTNIVVGGNGYITTTGSTNISSSNNYFTASSTSHILAPTQYTSGTTSYSHFSTGGDANATAAGIASALSTHNNYYNKVSNVPSIMKRIPNVEPWAQHENLDPTELTKDKTDREVADDIAFTINGASSLVPNYYNQYTTATDTFTKYKGNT
jgi:Type VI secretion system/phage-baseplate injector OB domain